MTLTPVQINIDEYPSVLHPYLDGAKLYDSSCSPDAQVIFIERDAGYFLKIGRIADLDREYEMTRYFHSKELAARVVEYCFDIGRDYLLTEKLRGDDCTTAKYLEQPKRLAELLGGRLALLHSLNYSDCKSGYHVTSIFALFSTINRVQYSASAVAPVCAWVSAEMCRSAHILPV
ncbi:MAG: hypothetical protein LBG12_11535, partial [Synergistaceae bacterium]|nr:hypothetical protein [Synergistaceae bacterium]